MPEPVSVKIEYRQLQKRIASAVKAVSDLSPAFVSIASDWYRNNQLSFFVTTGAGLYQDLNEKYKIRKMKAVGFVYPILVFSGRLKDSVTNAGSGETIRQINATSMTLGSTVPYGVYHQSTEPRTVMPYRPFIINQTLKGEKMLIFKTAVKRWTRIIDSYIKRKLKTV